MARCKAAKHRLGWAASLTILTSLLRPFLQPFQRRLVFLVQSGFCPIGYGEEMISI
jgi:hypothetical protein